MSPTYGTCDVCGTFGPIQRSAYGGDHADYVCEPCERLTADDAREWSPMEWPVLLTAIETAALS